MPKEDEQDEQEEEPGQFRNFGIITETCNPKTSALFPSHPGFVCYVVAQLSIDSQPLWAVPSACETFEVILMFIMLLNIDQDQI